MVCSPWLPSARRRRLNELFHGRVVLADSDSIVGPKTGVKSAARHVNNPDLLHRSTSSETAI